MSNPEGVAIASGAAGVFAVQMAAETDMVKNSALIKETKAITSEISKNLVSKIQAGKVGQTVAAQAGAKASAKLGGKIAASAIPGPLIDIAFGSVEIADHANQENVSDSMKAYNIAGDVVGIGVNIVLGLAGGPFAILIMAVQVLGGLLDAAWDPFKNYFNSDLETMRLGIIDALKVAYKEVNMNYPIETKPDILSGLYDPESEDSKEYLTTMRTYLEDRGFITKEEVIAEEEYFLNLKSMKRRRKLYRINQDGELEMQDPDLSAIALFDSAVNNDLIMIALAARYARSKGSKPKEGLSDQALTKYIIGALVISSLFLIFFFSIIFIASI
jgi:hypothetical protein